MNEEGLHSLEFLLAFDGHVHWYAEGYFTKFEIKRVATTETRPHGLRYSLTLHAPDGPRLMGFDNAHTVPSLGGRFVQAQVEADHWHRTEADEGRPYAFTSAAILIGDFFAEVERVLTERGVPLDVVGMDQQTRSN